MRAALVLLLACCPAIAETNILATVNGGGVGFDAAPGLTLDGSYPVGPVRLLAALEGSLAAKSAADDGYTYGASGGIGWKWAEAGLLQTGYRSRFDSHRNDWARHVTLPWVGLAFEREHYRVRLRHYLETTDSHGQRAHATEAALLTRFGARWVGAAEITQTDDGATVKVGAGVTFGRAK